MDPKSEYTEDDVSEIRANCPVTCDLCTVTDIECVDQTQQFKAIQIAAYGIRVNETISCNQIAVLVVNGIACDDAGLGHALQNVEHEGQDEYIEYGMTVFDADQIAITRELCPVACNLCDATGTVPRF